MLFDAGASFDIPNNENITPRDAMIKIEGQQLEDLKREIPAAWEDFGGLNPDMMGNVLPAPTKVSTGLLVASMPDTPADQVTDLSGVEESGKLTNSEGTANIPSFGGTEDSYLSAGMPAEHRWNYEHYNPSNAMFSSSAEVHQPETAWPQPTCGFFDPSQDPFMNPWTRDEDTEMLDQ